VGAAIGREKRGKKIRSAGLIKDNVKQKGTWAKWTMGHLSLSRRIDKLKDQFYRSNRHTGEREERNLILRGRKNSPR